MTLSPQQGNEVRIDVVFGYVRMERDNRLLPDGRFELAHVFTTFDGNGKVTETKRVIGGHLVYA